MDRELDIACVSRLPKRLELCLRLYLGIGQRRHPACAGHCFHQDVALENPQRDLGRIAMPPMTYVISAPPVTPPEARLASASEATLVPTVDLNGRARA
jgi:hypothetical protein